MTSKEILLAVAGVVLLIFVEIGIDAFNSRHDDPYGADGKLEAYRERNRMKDSLVFHYSAIEDSMVQVIHDRDIRIVKMQHEVAEAISEMKTLTKVVVTSETKKKAKTWIEEHNESLSVSSSSAP